MENTAPHGSSYSSRQGPASDSRDLSHFLRQSQDTPTHELASIAPLLPSTASPPARICGRSWTSTKPTVTSRLQRAYNGNRSNPRTVFHEPSRRPRTELGLLWPARAALPASNSTIRRTRARYSSRRVVSKANIVTQHPLEAIVENAAPVQNQTRRIRSAVATTPTEHVHGEASKISAVYSLSSTPTLASKSPTPSANSFHHPTSSFYATRPLRTITMHALSGLLNTLCAWRFRTFYADFLPQPGSSNDISVALLSPLQDALRAFDWIRTHTDLEAQCKQHELWRMRRMRYLASLLLLRSDRQVYKAQRDTAAMTGIPLRQIRNAVQAYAFWTEGEGQHHDQGTRANGMSRTLTSTQLATRKEWGELAAVLLRDLEDLKGRAAWVVNVLGAGRGQKETTMAKCKDRYFSHLAYGEVRRREALRGRFGWDLSRGNREGEGTEKLTDKRWKAEWYLSRKERDSMGGKDELIKKMHEKYRRDGVREARVWARIDKLTH